MPQYKVLLTREYRLREVGIVIVEAADPIAALGEAKRIEREVDDSIELSEVDGAPDGGSYVWAVYHAGSGLRDANVLLTGGGRAAPLPCSSDHPDFSPPLQRPLRRRVHPRLEVDQSLKRIGELFRARFSAAERLGAAGKAEALIGAVRRLLGPAASNRWPKSDIILHLRGLRSELERAMPPRDPANDELHLELRKSKAAAERREAKHGRAACQH
jgi:hypothetical protein